MVCCELTERCEISVKTFLTNIAPPVLLKALYTYTLIEDEEVINKLVHIVLLSIQITK